MSRKTKLFRRNVEAAPSARAMPHDEVSINGSVAIECVFCKGKGLDPFDILSPFSLCPVCAGRKVVELEDPIMECAFCNGTGVYPRTRLTCTACMGKGAQTVKEPVTVCPRCNGSGASINGSNLSCVTCHGSGVVPTNEE